MRTHRPLRVCRLLMLVLALCCGSLASAQPVLADDYPNRPIRLIVPLPPGGVVDTMARMLSERLRENLGQQIVIMNVAGAGGIIGAAQAAKASPDGYTLLMVYDTFAVNPSLYKNLSFDSFKDLTPVMELVKIPLVVAAPVALPANNLRELAVLARTRPNGVNYSSGGTGSSGQLAAELLRSSLGITKMTHIPYKGGGPALQATISGEVDFTILGTLVTVPQIRAGSLKALAVLGNKRATPLPQVPTAAEQGLTGFDASSWIGLLVPAGTPAAIVARVHAAFAQALKSPDVVRRMGEDGNEIIGSTPEQFASFLAQDAAKWAKIVKENNIRVE